MISSIDYESVLICCQHLDHINVAVVGSYVKSRLIILCIDCSVWTIIILCHTLKTKKHNARVALSPGHLSISQLLMFLLLLACAIKSWEIERGSGDEANARAIPGWVPVAIITELLVAIYIHLPAAYHVLFY